MRYDEDDDQTDPQVDMERLKAFALSAPDPRREIIPGLVAPTTVGVSHVASPPAAEIRIPQANQDELRKVAQSLALLRSSVVSGPTRLNLYERSLRSWP